jgi:hypothetical protein
LAERSPEWLPSKSIIGLDLHHGVLPPNGPPLIAFTGTSESLRRAASAVWVGRTRHDLGGESPRRWSPRSSLHDVVWHRKTLPLRPLLPLARVQSLNRVDESARALNDESLRVGTYGPSVGFCALRRLRLREATHTGFASPGCAASPGFLNLLTLCSARTLPALFHAGNALGLRLPEVSPSQ